MQNGLQQRTVDSANESQKKDDPFDPAIWKDKQDILQTFHISSSTLARWRKENPVRFKQYKRKCYYNILDIDGILETRPIKTEKPPMKWPISYLWTGFWIVEAILIVLPTEALATIITMVIPLLFVLPADIIIRIRKRNRRK